MTRLTTDDDAVYHARTQMTSVGYVSMVTPPDARYVSSRVSRASFIIIHHHHRQKRKKRGTLKKYLSFARRVDRRKRGGDVYIDGAPKRATVCVLTTCYLLSLSAAHKNAVVSSVRVSEVGARQVHGAVAIAMQRQARGGDVQVLRDATARLEKYVISRRRTRE